MRLRVLGLSISRASCSATAIFAGHLAGGMTENLLAALAGLARAVGEAHSVLQFEREVTERATQQPPPSCGTSTTQSVKASRRAMERNAPVSNTDDSGDSGKRRRTLAQVSDGASWASCSWSRPAKGCDDDAQGWDCIIRGHRWDPQDWYDGWHTRKKTWDAWG